LIQGLLTDTIIVEIIYVCNTHISPCRNARFIQIGRQKVTTPMTDIDSDLITMSRDELVEEVRKLRAGIRAHRDSTGHDLCWHHPALWSLLPEPVKPDIAVPPWAEFMRGCIRYRASLNRRPR